MISQSERESLRLHGATLYDLSWVPRPPRSMPLDYCLRWNNASGKVIITTPILAYLRSRRCNGEHPLAGDANERSNNAHHPSHQKTSPPALDRARAKAGNPITDVPCGLPVYAQSTGSDPWDNAVNVLKTAFTGTIATGLPLVAIVVAGIVFGVGMAIGAVNFMAWLFSQLERR